MRSSVALGPDGTMYFGSDDGRLYAFAANGKLRWTFHVRPRPGEFGADTWGDALDWSGDMGAWGALTADEELGYVYLPIETPTE